MKSPNQTSGIENSHYQMAPVFMPNDGERLRRIKVLFGNGPKLIVTRVRFFMEIRAQINRSPLTR